MYSAAQLWMDRAAFGATTNLSRRDDWVENTAKLCAAAGWIIRVNGSIFTVATQNTTMLSFNVFGGDPADDIFWRITRSDNGQFIHVIDKPKNNGYQPPGQVITTGGSNEPAATHQAVVLAIMFLLADKQPRVVSSIGLNSQIEINTPRNDFLVNLTIGSSLRTGTTDIQAWAGYVCQSQPSRKKYLRGSVIEEVGDENYISIYLTSKVEGGGDLDNNNIHVAGAKLFVGYATDVPRLDDEQPASKPGRTSTEAVGARGLDRLGQLDIARTVAFANPYQLILHSEIDPKPAFIFASALKLTDFRTSNADALPVTSANVFACRPGGNFNNRNFRSHSYMNAEVKRMEVNDKAFYGPTATDVQAPQLLLYQTLGSRPESADRCFWAGEIGEAFEPWMVMTPKAGGTGFVAGGLWDAMTIYEKTSNPTMNTFPWDGQLWMRYTKDGQAGLSAGNVPFTLCLRASRQFITPK